MGKGSGRRRENADAVRANWDVVFGPRIRVAAQPQTAREVCPKCGFASGDDWSQCRGVCPMPMSPHFTRSES